MKSSKPRPHDESLVRLLLLCQRGNHAQISLLGVWQHAVQGGVYVRHEALAEKKSRRSAFRVGFYSTFDLCECGIDFALSKQKISIPPGNFRGKRVHALGLK